MPPMRITSRGLAAATVGLVSAVVLAGCSSNSTKPTVLPSLPTTPAVTTPAAVATSHAPSAVATPSADRATATTASTATPEVTASSDGLAATTQAIASATRTYFVVINRAIQDSSALAEVKASFGASCQQCATDLANISKIHAAQRRVAGGGYKILKVTSQATDKSSGASTITFSTLADTIYDKSGKVLERDPAQPEQSAGITLSKFGTRWIVVGWLNFGKTT